MDNIILIGMPAVGKSTVGVIVAKRLGYNFVDTDLVIQEKEGKLLREIIAEIGPDGFLEVEDRVNAEIEAEKTVIATGPEVLYLVVKCNENITKKSEKSYIYRHPLRQ